jgi:Flp pilus assembly protein TadD
LRPTRSRHVLHVILLSFSLGATPAFAGLFDSSPQKLSAASDEIISEIQTAFDDERYVDASRTLDQALLSHGDDPRLAYWAAELNLVHGNFQDALTNFTAVKKDPKMHNQALAGEGIALSELGRHDEAMASLQAAVAGDPGAWRAWNALGSEYDRRHDWSNADSAYTRALSGSGDAAIVLNNRGYSLLSQKRPDLAIPDFVAALQKKPDLAVARSNLRLAMSMQGEYDRAIKGAREADQAQVLNNAGFAAMLRGDYGKAKELLTQAMKVKNGYYAIAAANLELTQNLAKGQ